MAKLKHQKKEVSNQQYEEAFKNEDNIRITKKVLSFYKDILDNETLKSCGLKGLWRCLQFHTEGFKNKFTTSLWRFVTWECENEKKKVYNNKHRKNKSIEMFDVEDNSEVSTDIFNDIDSLLDNELSSIIKLRFIENMTLQEIGAKFGYTKEAARQKLNRALSEVKRLVYNSE